MQIKHIVEYYLFIGLSKVIGLIGFENVKFLAKPLALLFYYVIPIRKNVVLNNLQIAFPKLSDAEIYQVAKKNYFSFTQTFLEILSLKKCSKEEIISFVQCDELDKIKSKLDESKGLIFMTAHYANWELGAIYFGIVLGQPIYVLAKRQRNRLVAGWLTSLRESFGNKEILLGTSVRELYKTLLQKGMIGVVADQRASRDSYRVKFFNKSTAVFTGTASIALKTKPPIFVVLLEREKDYSYTARINEINYDNLPEDYESQVKVITQRYMNILENHITKAPEHWFWMHNIWKY